MKYLTILLFVTTALIAQEAPEAAALKVREASAKAVKERKETPEASIAKLRMHGKASGLKVDGDVDFVLAALDVGQRLLAGGEPDAAAKFFREVEKTLDFLVKKTPETMAVEKAALLQRRAFVRGRFLNNAKAAVADLDHALILRPGDAVLLDARDRLLSENSALLTVEGAKR